MTKGSGFVRKWCYLLVATAIEITSKSNTEATILPLGIETTTISVRDSDKSNWINPSS